MKLGSFFAMAVAAAAMVAAAGCASTPYYPSDTRVTVAENLGRSIYVRDARCAKLAGSPFATFQATVVNVTHRPIDVEWKVEWLDASGFACEGLTSYWQTANVAPMDHAALKGVAPTQDAVDMRIYVRRLAR